MRRLLALFLAFGLVTAACGSDDDGGDAAASEETEDVSAEESADESEDDADQVEVTDVDAEELESPGRPWSGDPTPTDRGPESSGTLDFAWHTAFSPKWFDPALNTSSVSQFATQYVLHDALVKSMPDRPFFRASLGSTRWPIDFTSVNFVLREGLTFPRRLSAHDRGRKVQFRELQRHGLGNPPGDDEGNRDHRRPFDHLPFRRPVP